MDVDTRLPSERQLCIDFNVSRTTVRNAIAELEHRGLVRRKQGKGTFVRRPQRRRENLSNYYSFSEGVRRSGRKPKTLILEYHIAAAGEERAQAMELEKETLLIEFLRLRLADDEPMLLERTFIPYDLFPEVTKLLLEELPLYTIFEKRYKRKVHRVEENFSVGRLTAGQARHLKEKTDDPCLQIVRKSFDKRGQLIELTESVASGTKFDYETSYYPR